MFNRADARRGISLGAERYPRGKLCHFRDRVAGHYAAVLFGLRRGSIIYDAYANERRRTPGLAASTGRVGPVVSAERTEEKGEEERVVETDRADSDRAREDGGGEKGDREIEDVGSPQGL